MNNKKIYYLISVIAVPVIIYFYFLKWKTGTIYGDDLAIYVQSGELSDFFDKVNLSLAAGKYRPISGFVSAAIMQLFRENLDYYYLFNVGVAAVNTLLLAEVLNLFVRSRWMSVLLGLMYAFSRFSLYNITQVINGGALEGLAIAFFLVALFFVAKVMARPELKDAQKQKSVMWGVLFANLCLYTHERYIVLLFFILLLPFFLPLLRSLPIKNRLNILGVVAASIVLNVVVKKFIFDVPFFVGTGGTNIKFSFSTAYSFFVDGLLSLMQINTGPEYLVGIEFISLPMSAKFAVLGVVLALIVVCCFYLAKILKALMIYFLSQVVDKSVLKQEPDIPRNAVACFFMLMLFGFCLAPAVVTIRLEQRWLQASFVMMIVVLAIAYDGVTIRSWFIKYALLASFVYLFAKIDFNYLEYGADKTYLKGAERIASKFREAVDKKVIHEKTSVIFISNPSKDINAENEVIWSISDGSIFKFYQDRRKKVIFIDSAYQRSFTDTLLSRLNKDNHQIVQIGSSVIDLTNHYLRDSLKSLY